MGDLLKLMKPKYTPVAIYHVKEFPKYASKPSEESCVIASMLLHAFKSGRTVAMSYDMVGCRGALNGLGLGGEEKEKRDALAVTYSVGTEEKPGRHYFCSPESARKNYFDAIPVYGSRDDIVVMQPIDEAEEMGAPVETVVFLVNPLDLSALVTMAGFIRDIDDTVIRTSFAFSCEQIFAMAKQEGEREVPRMILGLTEFYTRRFLDDDMLSISMSYKMYKEMDEKASSSFIAQDLWRNSAKPGKDSCC